MPGNSNDLQALGVIDDAFHGEVLRGLEHDDVPMRVRSRLQRARNGTLPWVRTQAHEELRRNACSQGNGVLAHVNFSPV